MLSRLQISGYLSLTINLPVPEYYPSCFGLYLSDFGFPLSPADIPFAHVFTVFTFPARRPSPVPRLSGKGDGYLLVMKKQIHLTPNH